MLEKNCTNPIPIPECFGCSDVVDAMQEEGMGAFKSCVDGKRNFRSHDSGHGDEDLEPAVPSLLGVEHSGHLVVVHDQLQALLLAASGNGPELEDVRGVLVEAQLDVVVGVAEAVVVECRLNESQNRVSGYGLNFPAFPPSGRDVMRIWPSFFLLSYKHREMRGLEPTSPGCPACAVDALSYSWCRSTLHRSCQGQKKTFSTVCYNSRNRSKSIFFMGIALPYHILWFKAFDNDSMTTKRGFLFWCCWWYNSVCVGDRLRVRRKNCDKK